jgi:hypothetical protein
MEIQYNFQQRMCLFIWKFSMNKYEGKTKEKIIHGQWWSHQQFSSGQEDCPLVFISLFIHRLKKLSAGCCDCNFFFFFLVICDSLWGLPWCLSDWNISVILKNIYIYIYMLICLNFFCFLSWWKLNKRSVLV